MKIRFLGTSAGWPLPRLGCRDDVCSSKDPRDTRTRSQALINDILLLDAGPDTYSHLRTVDPTKIKAAAITHEHSDHTFGLWDLSHIYSENGKLKLKLFINKKTLSKIRFVFYPNQFEIVIVEPNTPIKFENLYLTFLPVQHTKETSFAIFVEEKDKSFLWVPDFISFSKEAMDKARKASIIAMDGSELKIQTHTSHQTIMEGINLGKQFKNSQIYFTHLGHRVLPHRELEELVRKTGGKNFNIAYDGLEIKI
jgi:phosphoribosyl 1,2-cyclic phosphate phosphodiesterase